MERYEKGCLTPSPKKSQSHPDATEQRGARQADRTTDKITAEEIKNATERDRQENAVTRDGDPSVFVNEEHSSIDTGMPSEPKKPTEHSIEDMEDTGNNSGTVSGGINVEVSVVDSTPRPKLRRTSSSLPLRLTSLPKVNCREKIVLCIDHSDEMFHNKFATHSSASNPVFKTLVSAVKQFVSTKSYLKKNNQFSLLLLNDEAQLITDLNRNHDEIFMMLNHIATVPVSQDYDQTDVDKVFDLSPMFDMILEQSGISESSKQFIAPQYVVRVLFIYGRSDTRLVFSSGRSSFNTLIKYPQFFLDCVYIHEPPRDDNIVEKIFSSICDLDIGGTSYIHEVGTDSNVACLFNVFAKLLAHPLQRPKQQESPEYELKPDSFRYGLIIPKSKTILVAKKNAGSKKSSVFGDDSSSDEDAHKEVNAQIHQEALKKKIQKQTKIEIQKALEQDATVYEYDSIYDDMKEKSKKKVPAGVAKADKQRKPKYIGSLMKAAEKRAKERERIEERKIQREREKEGGEFDDKEEFVTSAYRQKMLERQKDIEEEKRMDAIEEALDVRKQKDLTGFYRNFLNRELCEDPRETTTTDANDEVVSAETQTATNQEDEDTDLSFSSSDEDQNEIKETKIPNPQRQSSSPKHSSNHKERRAHDRSHYDRSPKRRRSHEQDNGRSRRRDRHSRSRSPNIKNYFSPGRSHDEGRKRQKRSRERYERSPDRQHRRRHDHDKDDRNRTRGESYERHRESSRDNLRDGHHRRSSREGGSNVLSNNNSPKSVSNSDEQFQTSEGLPTEVTKETGPPTIIGPAEETKPLSSFAKRTNEDKALSARERFLARKAAQKVRPVVHDSD